MRVSRRSVLRAAGLAAVPAGAAGCTSSSLPVIDELVLATGPDGAVFREVGGALAAALADELPSTRVVERHTGASVENVRLLRSGEVHLGLSSLDPLVDGTVLSAEDPGGISAVGRLYDSFMQIAVPAGSPLRTLSDLAGRTVSFGPSESGTEFTATRLLSLLGIDVDARRMAHADAAEQLVTGELDAVLALTGIPTPAITDTLRAFPLRLLDLPAEAEALAEAYPGPYVPATIPATTYGDLGPCRTFAVPNLLLARTSLDADVVEVVTRTVFTQSARIAAGHPEASRINVRTGIATGQAPLHQGAERWFRATKR
ncbi:MULTISPECIES: TAXI family TRAP transporter solute-binding subunit [Saccharothrix]|uniref:TAXI family TRAP transporter solute-binding subunit n=1 Tax=Saccharothrix TaxID=2071 RepID=UPI001F520360|nr:TAXI family TRAP transporter solute-binding subunit [Saccharothrix sp. CB00851]